MSLTPFYQDELTTIYHGDCEEIAPKLGRFDLLLTDPPYGLKRVMKGGLTGNYDNFRKLYDSQTWDLEPPPLEFILGLIQQATISIIWGGTTFNFQPRGVCSYGTRSVEGFQWRTARSLGRT
jgi:DNA modification methylase